MILSLFSLVALVPLALAAVHQVSVGGLQADGKTPNLMFTPNVVQAAVNDLVVFTFHVKNHTVTQSAFETPCSKLVNSYGQLAGFDSGFFPVDPSLTSGFPTFNFTVTDTAPVWGYCRQLNPPTTHCQSGMVFSINPPSSGNTFDRFLALAKSSTSQNSLLPPTSTTPPTTSTPWTSPPPASVVTVTETVTVDENVWTTTYGSWPGSSAPTPAKYPTNHKIVVGGDPKTVGFTYNPSNITADIGDTVTFQFMVKNHTVTQSAFGTPCRKLADTTYPVQQGFDSGFMPVGPNDTYFPNFTITVNDTAPIWGYCRQQAANFSHCGVGMVFSINAVADSPHSFDAFQQLAVHQNGTGIVDPFGNITAPSNSTASSYSDVSKTVGALDAASSSSDPDSNSIHKLLSYVPTVLGLLGAAVAILLVLLAVSVVLLIRSRKTTGTMLPTRAVKESYRPVPLAMPSSKIQDDGSHDYETPRYADGL